MAKISPFKSKEEEFVYRLSALETKARKTNDENMKEIGELLMLLFSLVRKGE